MKILYYNWDPVGGPAGGGVTGYLVELLTYLREKRPDWEIWFLNSGRKYDGSDEIYVTKRENSFGSYVQSYEIVNSPILAPGRQSVTNFKLYMEDEKLEKVVGDFIAQNGPFDVIHLHNIEGISSECLRLKRRTPDTKWILSLHNYFPFCPQVNLWKAGGINCDPKEEKDCTACFASENYELARFRFIHLDIKGLKGIFAEYSAENPERIPDGNVIYDRFRKSNIESINEYFDKVLCVSEQTLKLAERAGIKKDILQLSYAGSKVAEEQKNGFSGARGNVLRIIYLGYAGKEKGFYFFADALLKMPDELKRKLDVTIVARADDKAMEQIEKVKAQSVGFAGFRFFNGYTDKNELDELLKDKDLGIVPVLWEDNLPRVAMEMYAAGIPLLTSNLGGAKGNGGNNGDNVIRAGDRDDFIRKLNGIISDKGLLEQYFENSMQLMTMEKHVNELSEIYGCRD